MNLRTFFTSQNVQPSELNGVLTDIDKAIGQAGYETGGFGVAYGLTVAPTDPVTMAVRVQPGVALWFDPSVTGSTQRLKAARLSTATSMSMAANYLGASTAVSAGQERWEGVICGQEKRKR